MWRSATTWFASATHRICRCRAGVGRRLRVGEFSTAERESGVTYTATAGTPTSTCSASLDREVFD
jgi:hypothetical protein